MKLIFAIASALALIACTSFAANVQTADVKLDQVKEQQRGFSTDNPNILINQIFADQIKKGMLTVDSREPETLVVASTMLSSIATLVSLLMSIAGLPIVTAIQFVPLLLSFLANVPILGTFIGGMKIISLINSISVILRALCANVTGTVPAICAAVWTCGKVKSYDTMCTQIIYFCNHFWLYEHSNNAIMFRS